MDLNSLKDRIAKRRRENPDLKVSKSVSYFDAATSGYPTKGSVILNPNDMVDTVYRGSLGLAYVVKPDSAVDTDKPISQIAYSAVTGKHFVLEDKSVTIGTMQCRCDISALTMDVDYHIQEVDLGDDTRRVIWLDRPVKVTFSTLPKVYLPAKENAWQNGLMKCNQPKENYSVFKLTPVKE